MKYKVTAPYSVGSGTILDKNNTPIPVAQLAPKVGDTVNGDIASHFVFNSTIKGLAMEIGIPGGSASQVSKIIIPARSLTAASSSGSASSVPAANWQPEFNFYTAAGAMAGIGVGFGAYKMSGKSSILMLVLYCAIGGISGIAAGSVADRIISQ